MKKHTIDIIEIDDLLEANAIRGVLEYFSVRVNFHLIALADEIVDLLGDPKKTSDNVLIMCHGDNKGIFLPDVDPKIGKKQPFQKQINHKDLKSFLKLDGKLVINTGCCLGKKEYPKTFLESGAKNYIAPNGYPEGTASLMFITNFYYHLFAKKKTVKQAYESAKSIDSYTKIFKLH